MIAIERYSLDQADMGDELGFVTVDVASIADRQGMIDR